MSQLRLLHRRAATTAAFSGRNTLNHRTNRCRGAFLNARALPIPSKPAGTPDAQQATSCSPVSACVEQALRLCCSQNGSNTATFFLLAAAIGGLTLLAPDAAHAADSVSSAAPYHPVEIAQTAENDEFWSNVVRYVRYFFTVTSGGLYALASPFLNLFKKPTTAIVALVVGAGAVYVLKFTLDAMLGISEPFEYTPGSPVTYAASPYVGQF